jgi:hypothetical protein
LARSYFKGEITTMHFFLEIQRPYAPNSLLDVNKRRNIATSAVVYPLSSPLSLQIDPRPSKTISLYSGPSRVLRDARSRCTVSNKNSSSEKCIRALYLEINFSGPRATAFRILVLAGIWRCTRCRLLSGIWRVAVIPEVLVLSGAHTHSPGRDSGQRAAIDLFEMLCSQRRIERA